MVCVDERSPNTAFVVKDPVSLKYFRLRPDEKFVLERLDGTSSLQSIQTAYEMEFAPARVSPTDLQLLVHRFHEMGLVISDGEGQGTVLSQRGFIESRQQWLGVLTNFLFIRFPGIDPEPILRVLYPLVRWCFHPAMLLTSLVTCVAAAVMFVLNFQQFVHELPSVEGFLNRENLLTMMLALGVTKILHEFGHALACRHFGGECHEIGPMLLVMTPALYCDTSDSWMLPSRWQRAAVGAAGMYVELVIAAIATVVWCWTEPGYVHYLCVRLMLICSLSTVIFNANPLLRYDGYYILSDLCNVPNLGQKAQQQLAVLLRSLTLGITDERADEPYNRPFLVTYAIASTAYRWTVLLGILFFVSRALRPFHLRELGNAIACLAIGGMLVVPARQSWKYFESPVHRNQIRPGRVTLSLLVATGILAVMLLLPLPHNVQATATITSETRQPIYALSSGFIRAAPTRPGTIVQRGDILLQLDNDELLQNANSSRRRMEQQRLAVETLERSQIRFPAVAGQLPAARSALEDARRQFERANRQLDTLVIKAPRDGRLLSPARHNSAPGQRELPSWSGFPTDEENVGAWIETGTPIGWIDETSTPLAELVVQQSDLPFVHEGQSVTCLVHGYNDRVFDGEVVEISTHDMSTESADATRFAGNPSAPKFSVYHVKARLTTARDTALLPGSTGYARIRTGHSSLGRRLYVWLCKTLRLT